MDRRGFLATLLGVAGANVTGATSAAVEAVGPISPLPITFTLNGRSYPLLGITVWGGESIDVTQYGDAGRRRHHEQLIMAQFQGPLPEDALRWIEQGSVAAQVRCKGEGWIPMLDRRWQIQVTRVEPVLLPYRPEGWELEARVVREA